jgi:hypothetical protein
MACIVNTILYQGLKEQKLLDITDFSTTLKKIIVFSSKNLMFVKRAIQLKYTNNKLQNFHCLRWKNKKIPLILKIKWLQLIP